MAQPVIQTSFHAGEWAPALNARVDLAKYHSAAALLRNFFVDYRGGASTRTGTEYILTAGNYNANVRVIPFQASPSVGYILEFGDRYLRFYNNGAPVLETAINITNVSGNTITAANSYGAGNWVYISGVNGITNINDKYFIISSATGASFTVVDLFGNPVTFTGGYISGGTAARVYTIGTPYTSQDLFLLKYAQSVDKLIICHTSYPPSVLTLVAADNWTLVPITFGATVSAPTGLTAPSTNGGAGHFGYVVTALDVNGQESTPSIPAYTTINITAGAIATANLTWNAVTGASSYNVYRTPEADTANPPAGSALGFVMNVTAPNASDAFYSNSPQNSADFSKSPPVAKNPFQGAGVDHTTVTNAGAYTTVPTVAFAAAPAGGDTATGVAILGMTGVAVTGSTGVWAVGQPAQVNVGSPVTNVAVAVASVDGFGNVLTVIIGNPGALSGGSTPANPVVFLQPNGANTISVNVTWGVTAVNIISSGAGYTSAPAITFSAGAAAATAVLQSTSAGNPGVPGLFQQRLVLAAKPLSVQTFDMSQPGSYYNFNVSNPVQPDDAISASIVSGQLNEIQSMVSVPTGLLLLTSKANWLVHSTAGGAVTAIDVNADAHSYNGASELPPIIANFDILFVQDKGSIVRDLTFNFVNQIFTGTDISVLSSHLFYGYTIVDWAWAEEPFKIVHAVRDDGELLMLTYLKEQELIGWAHSDTNGSFKSVAVVTEPYGGGSIDAVYVVVERNINGQGVKYIERFAERLFTNGAQDAWCVDSALQYDGPPATTFSGLEHLTGMTVTGLADGLVIPAFTMPASGSFTLTTPASKVTVGLSFLPQLQTLPIDTGEPTIQGKMKVIPEATIRVQNTLGLTIGATFASAVAMKDLQLGQVGSATNTVVTGLVTADAKTVIDARYTVPGQYCIAQPNPWPATILGVIPEVSVGDTAK